MQRVLLFIVSLCVVFLLGCDSDIDSNSLIGMSKEEILRLAFAKCPKNTNGELNIGAWEIEKNGKKSYQNFYYKSFEAAKMDIRLMSSNIWEIGKKYKFSFSIQRKEECLELFFEKGNVVKVEKTYWDKT
ncbi:MAG TPA: hypothetical protein K8W19_04180 [Victivallis vadensis]|nr:hypothetical protein [Victivallis vadensis]